MALSWTGVFHNFIYVSFRLCVSSFYYSTAPEVGKYNSSAPSVVLGAVLNKNEGIFSQLMKTGAKIQVSISYLKPPLPMSAGRVLGLNKDVRSWHPAQTEQTEKNWGCHMFWELRNVRGRTKENVANTLQPLRPSDLVCLRAHTHPTLRPPDKPIWPHLSSGPDWINGNGKSWLTNFTITKLSWLQYQAIWYCMKVEAHLHSAAKKGRKEEDVWLKRCDRWKTFGPGVQRRKRRGWHWWTEVNSATTVNNLQPWKHKA